MITHEAADSEYCTITEAAQLLRVSKPTVSRWIDSGRLPAVRKGPRAIRIKKADIDLMTQPVRPRRPMTLAELEPYIIHRGDPTRSQTEVMASIRAINRRILARRGGKLLEPSLPLIHEARRERDERL